MYSRSSPRGQAVSLTVLEAQDDVPEVEASLLLWEGLVAGHFHDWPVRKEGGLLSGIRSTKGCKDWGTGALLGSWCSWVRRT